MTRGRKPMMHEVVGVVQVNEEAVAASGRAATALGEAVKKALERYMDGRPYEREAFVDEVRFFIAQGDMAYYQAGLRLICMKETEPHGDFLNIVEERLGLTERSAQKMMQVSARLRGNALSASATKLLALGPSKVSIMLFEDDDTVAAFASKGGSIAGLTFDQVDAMTVRELRAHVREQRATIKAKDRVSADKDRRYNDLLEQHHRLTSAEPDELEKQQLDLLGEVMLKADNALKSALGIAAGVMQKAATGLVDLQAQQSVQALMRRLVDCCMKYGFSIDLAAEVDPFWLMEIKRVAAEGMGIEEQKRAARAAKRKLNGEAGGNKPGTTTA